MATINSAVADTPPAVVDFTWSPVGAAVTYTFAGNTYPPAGSRFEAFFTPVGQVITFVADVIAAPGTSIIQYRWSMGDGVIKFGSTIGHTYNVPNPSLTTKLEITDSLNRRFYVSKVMLLQVQFGTVVSEHLRV